MLLKTTERLLFVPQNTTERVKGLKGKCQETR